VERGFGLSISIGNLLDAIDQSFCTDKDKAVGQDCSIYSPTRVTSISYGASEVDYPEALQQRQCHEFLKLGLQGHTFTISSGDYGVAAQPSFIYDTNGCITPGNYKATTIFGGPKLNGTVFNPIYPQNCPYVLSVGGTQLNNDETVLDSEVVMYQPQLLHFNISGIPNPPTTFSSSG
jgi:tripeptidyl-peptidase-1